MRIETLSQMPLRMVWFVSNRSGEVIYRIVLLPPRLTDPLAHSPFGGRGHPLEQHARSTAELAETYGSKFGSGSAGYILGLLHDLGKAAPEFQSYLAAATAGRSAPRFPHAKWGAALIWQTIRSNPTRQALAMAILGHHAGLGNAPEVRQDLDALIKNEGKRLSTLAAAIPRGDALTSAIRDLATAPAGATDTEMRFLFSALIDADRTDTARHFGQTLPDDRILTPALFETWNRHGLPAPTPEAPILAHVRHAIRRDCLAAAAKPTGLFLLTAPTGSGKTLSGMEFALHHAREHDLERVIVVLPYTSITQQTARTLRERLPNDVLEHHSQVSFTASEDDDGVRDDTRLATERWDVPVIVTTGVQFFESLFANRPAQLRKLHRIAKSVIILDEFQAFPPHLLRPTLGVLRELTTRFGASVVLSSATQPALDALPPELRMKGREIVQDVPAHFAALKRVEFELRPHVIEWGTLADEVMDLPQALVILNTKRQAVALLDALAARGDASRLHLSTSMCGVHRERVLHEVESRLKADAPVHLVSTQVVEAGVDIDFPVVYRALGPLERIIQAAGRCNREGKSDKGRVTIFRPVDESSPRGVYRTGLGLAGRLLDEHGARALEDLTILREYFQEVYANENLDRHGIDLERQRFKFKKVAELYRLIEESTRTVVVDYPGEAGAHELARRWARSPSLSGLRQLQPHLVSLRTRDWETAKEEGLIEPLFADGEIGIWTGRYDPHTGIRHGERNPEELVI